MSEKRQLARRAGVVGFFTFVSRLTGLARDTAIAHAFGTRFAADAFFVAFRIPNLLRRLFAEGALTVSFVPHFTRALKESEEEARQISNTAFSLLTLVLCVIVAFGMVFSPILVKLTAWGFSDDPEKFHLTVHLTRVMFPYILMVSLAALVMGVLNSLKHFAAPAASSIFMNLGIIFGAMVLTNWYHPPIEGLAVGVLIGGFLQLAVQIPFLRKGGFIPRWRWDPHHPLVRKIIGMMLPSAYGAAVYQFNVIVITFLASFLPSGSISYLWYADRVTEFPLGIFAVSLATVILPTLSEHAANEDMVSLKKTFSFGLKILFFITLPASVGLIVLSPEVIHMLFHHGEFGDASTQATAAALMCFAMGMPFVAGVRVTSNAFYSLQDSKTPVRIANMAVVINLVLSLVLMFFLQHRGLALALALSSLFSFVMQMRAFQKKVGGIFEKETIVSLLKSLIAALLMGLSLFWVKKMWLLGDLGFLQEVIRLFSLIGLGVGIYTLMGYVLRMQELKDVERLLLRKFKKTAH